MRCQKVRSCLSAYCRDELSGRDLMAIREHLAGCALCRREEAMMRAMFTDAKVLPGPRVSDDFNAKLLHRIAQERFTETRTRAYMPRRAPVFSWPRLIPVAAITALAVFAVVGSGYFGDRDGITTTSGPQAQLDDSYLTAQPDQNPNMAVSIGKNWSFRSQIAQAERANKLTGSLTSHAGFASSEPRLVVQFNTPVGNDPRDVTGVRMRPIYRMYEPAAAPQAKEAHSVY